MNPFSFIKNFFLKFNKEKIAIHQKVTGNSFAPRNKTPEKEIRERKQQNTVNVRNSISADRNTVESSVPYDFNIWNTILASNATQTEEQSNKSTVQTVVDTPCETVKSYSDTSSYSSYDSCSSSSSSDSSSSSSSDSYSYSSY